MPVLLSVLLAASVAGTADDALIVDIRAASPVEVAALKQGDGVHWWLELGNRMLLAGDAAVQSRLPASTPVLEHLSNLRVEDLALRAVGCDIHEDAPGRLLARGGRWQLRQLAVGEALPRDADETWRAVQPNEVVARQYRLDAPLAAPADPRVLPLVQHVDTARWFADLGQLASWDRSSYGTVGLYAARDWIGAQFTGLGLTVTKPDFTMPGASGGSITRQNVIGMWTGTTLPDEWVVVGAHYDSRNAGEYSIVDTPGAEDNASGCAGVIEIARALLPFRPQRSVLFMCYAGEEQGLYGSERHVQALQASGDIAKVTSVVIMDMIGYSEDDHLDADYESYAEWQPYLNRFGAAAATYAPELNISISLNPSGSDHMPYLWADKQAVLGIESDYDSYPHYHESTDIPANMGPHAQAMGGAILKTNVAVLADLAGASDGVFRDGFD